MKLVGIVGSNNEKSYNRLLLQNIQKTFAHLFEIELLEIDKVPLFNQSDDQTESEPIQYLNRKIKEADGVIIATPEHNRTVPPALKSVIEWLSFKVHPFEDKPVLIVGASYFDQGTSRAQLHLKQIMESPGVGAYVFPGNEFLLGDAREAFDANGLLKNPTTVGFLREVLEKFVRYVQILNHVDDPAPKPITEAEDLMASGKIDTTIDVDMNADDWVEQAAKKVNAVSGDTYVELNHGIMTVNQLNYFLNSMPMELTYADSNNQFLYYNYHIEEENMLAKRRPSQVGSPLAKCHPASTHKNVATLISKLRTGELNHFRVRVPTHGADKFVVHNYRAMRDDDGNYIGINEYVEDLQPLIDWYLEQTGQELVGGHVDGVSGATAHTGEADAVSGATSNTNSDEADAITGASATEHN